MRKTIKKILSEEMGVQGDVKNITEKLTPQIMDDIINMENDNHGFIYNIHNNHIDQIRILINIDNEIVSDGKLQIRDIKRNKNNKYSFSIELNINKKDINNKKIIGSILSHELNHVFVYLMKIDKREKTFKLNSVRNMLKITTKNEKLKEFLNMFYLNLPEEIQARIQETDYILNDMNINDYNDMINVLYQYQPINDAKKMIYYNINNLNGVDDETLENFVIEFNKNIEHLNIDIKIIKDKDKFFSYWIKFINEGGYKLNMKILKLVSKYYQKNEEQPHWDMDGDLLCEIFNLK